METRFCIDCIYHNEVIIQNVKYDKCKHEREWEEVSLVYGKRMIHETDFDCYKERYIDEMFEHGDVYEDEQREKSRSCGSIGRYFERKP